MLVLITCIETYLNTIKKRWKTRAAPIKRAWLFFRFDSLRFFFSRSLRIIKTQIHKYLNSYNSFIDICKLKKNTELQEIMAVNGNAARIYNQFLDLSLKIKNCLELFVFFQNYKTVPYFMKCNSSKYMFSLQK